tara:strand:+ start:344 stop:517 length:174 start_codon:yes stop_codon:yes gene_type:complete
MEETKGTYDVFTVFEDVMASDLDEYQIKQLAMMLIANTLTEQTAKETAEMVIKRTNE